MLQLCFYRDDYVYNPRDTEWSEKVVRQWYDEKARYADEDIPDDQCMRIVAERLLVRRLLGLEALDRTYMPKASRVEPFGPETPILAELLMPETFVAMALVPLSPQGLQGEPILARLYCVSGLSARYTVPLDGNDETALQEFSWFLAGVPQNAIHGRSWLLAANLLARIVVKRDVKTARNLAKHYIVTGDVSDGAIRHVEMLRKSELAKQKHFDDLKWIIPKENDMDIPKRKIEKPATLEEAYQLIESMQNTLTRDLCAIVNRDIDTQDEEWLQRVDRIRDLLARGADPNAMVQGKCAWGVYRDKLDHFLDSDKNLDAWSREQAILMYRTFSFYGAIPQFFFMLAHAGEKNMLEALSRSGFDIDAIDSYGETALDFAEEVNDVRAKELLIACGAKKCGRFLVNSNRFWIALGSFINDQYLGRQEAEKVLAESLDKGLSPNDVFSLGPEGRVSSDNFKNTIPVPVDHDPLEPWEEHEWEDKNYILYEFATTRYESTILLEALYIGNKPIVEKCLAIGVCPDLEIRTKYGSVLRKKLIEGKVVEKNEDKLIVSDTWRKAESIDAFIRSANERNEFPDKGLVTKVIKYFDGLKSQVKV